MYIQALGNFFFLTKKKKEILIRSTTIPKPSPITLYFSPRLKKLTSSVRIGSIVYFTSEETSPLLPLIVPKIYVYTLPCIHTYITPYLFLSYYDILFNLIHIQPNNIPPSSPSSSLLGSSRKTKNQVNSRYSSPTSPSPTYPFPLTYAHVAP